MLYREIGQSSGSPTGRLWTGNLRFLADKKRLRDFKSQTGGVPVNEGQAQIRCRVISADVSKV